MTTLPTKAGICLKAEHYLQLIEHTTSADWLEVHPENYMGSGGPPHRYLSKLREDYPVSMHGVGMSLGSADGVDQDHIKRLKYLVERYQPTHVSEHLSWSHWNSIYLNDLLPLPYTRESLELICANIDRVQSALGRTILIENPATCIDFAHSDYSEPDFFSEVVSRCGCDILLDINNVFVSAENNGFDSYQYLDKFPKSAVKQIHLAGHSVVALTEHKNIRIDDHGSEVIDEVWDLYSYFFTLTKRPIATLIEWDTDIPSLDTLLVQADKANSYMEGSLSKSAKVMSK